MGVQNSAGLPFFRLLTRLFCQRFLEIKHVDKIKNVKKRKKLTKIIKKRKNFFYIYENLRRGEAACLPSRLSTQYMWTSYVSNLLRVETRAESHHSVVADAIGQWRKDGKCVSADDSHFSQFL